MIDSSLSAHKKLSSTGGGRAFHPPSAASGDRLASSRWAKSGNAVGGLRQCGYLQAAVRRMPADAALRYMTHPAGLSLPGARGEDRRRVMILVTDAGRERQQSRFRRRPKRAVRSGSLLYTIVIRPIKKRKRPQHGRPKHALENNYRYHGWACSSRTPPANWTVFRSHQPRVRTQYRLGITPPARRRKHLSGDRVKVSGKYQVRHRTVLTLPAHQ